MLLAAGPLAISPHHQGNVRNPEQTFSILVKSETVTLGISPCLCAPSLMGLQDKSFA